MKISFLCILQETWSMFVVSYFWNLVNSSRSIRLAGNFGSGRPKDLLQFITKIVVLWILRVRYPWIHTDASDSRWSQASAGVKYSTTALWDIKWRSTKSIDETESTSRPYRRPQNMERVQVLFVWKNEQWYGCPQVKIQAWMCKSSRKSTISFSLYSKTFKEACFQVMVSSIGFWKST